MSVLKTERAALHLQLGGDGRAELGGLLVADERLLAQRQDDRGQAQAAPLHDLRQLLLREARFWHVSGGRAGGHRVEWRTLLL